MENISRSEFFHATDDIKRLIEGTNDRLDRQNGRLRKVEIKIAAQWLLWCIVGGGLTVAIPVVYAYATR